MDIQVTNFRKNKSDGKTRAFADVRFADALLVRGFSLVEGSQGLFVSPPRKPGKNGNWFDMVVVDEASLKQEIESKIFEIYDLHKAD